MNDIKAFEANCSAPLAEIRPGIVERIAEFDEHVQRHEQTEDVLAAGIVNAGVDCDQRTARREEIVSRADKVHLLFQVPSVKNHTQRDEIRLGQRHQRRVHAPRGTAATGTAATGTAQRAGDRPQRGLAGAVGRPAARGVMVVAAGAMGARRETGIGMGRVCGPRPRANAAGLNQNRLLLGVGASMQTWKGLVLRFEYQRQFGTSGETDQSVLLNLQKRF